jgi:hypothetical protein
MATEGELPCESLALVLIISQINPLHNTAFYISQIHFNIILPRSLVVKALGYKPEGHGFKTR